MEWLKSNWVTVVVAAYLISMMLYGHYKGFMRTALSLTTAILAVVFTIPAAPFVKNALISVFNLSQADPFRLNLLIFVITFILILILLKIFVRITDVMTKIPVIHGLNQIAGAVLGLILGLIFVWVGCLILGIFNETPLGTEIAIQVYESRFLSFIYQNNMLYRINFLLQDLRELKDITKKSGLTDIIKTEQ